MQREDLERIARTALKELGLPNADMTLTEDPHQAGQWLLHFRGPHGQGRMKIRCGQGTSPQYVREQVFQQFPS